MPIKVTCPKCQGVLHAPDDAGGKRGKCPTCQTVLAIPAEPSRVGGGLAPPPEPAIKPVVSQRLGEDPLPTGRPLPPVENRTATNPVAPKVETETRRSSMGRMSPPAFGGTPDPRRSSDPFARTSAGPVGNESPEYTLLAWRRARRGLSLVQLGLFFLMIAAIATPALAIAAKFGVQIPDQTPGYLGNERMSSAMEISIGAVAIPLALGLLLTTLGKIGFGNVPRSSFAKGVARLSGYSALLALLGIVAAGLGFGGQIANGFFPLGKLPNGAYELTLLPSDDPMGMAQRIGIVVAAIFLPLSLMFLVSGIGKVGANLLSRTATLRHTRFLFLVGFLLAVVGAVAVSNWCDPRMTADLTTKVRQTIDGWMAQAGENRDTLIHGLMILAALVVWMMLVRLVGGARRAMRDWILEHDPNA